MGPGLKIRYKAKEALEKQVQKKKPAEAQHALVKKYKHKMISGFFWAAAGTVITVVTYNEAVSSPTGGTYVVAWGAIPYGIIDFFRGFFGWLTAGSEKKAEVVHRSDQSIKKALADDVRNVEFIREDREERNGIIHLYRIHHAPDAASAQAFLQLNPVTRKYYYIVVETPEGNYGRDFEGIYEE